MSGYPRQIRTIKQIEISSRCNLRCVYCPSRHLDKPIKYPGKWDYNGGSGRAKMDISTEHYTRALEWAMHMQSAGTQDELALTGIGEALLHPMFVEFLRMAREALPEKFITFSTNGLLLTDELCEQMEPYKPAIFVSTHVPVKAKKAIDIARKWGLLAGTNTAFATSSFNWAGQLDWEVSIPQGLQVCEFLRLGWGVVLSDGRITTCCLDATGDGCVGHVDDEIGSLSIQPWKGRVAGCSTCHMRVPEMEEMVA